jgi:hypothetical protein
MILALLAFSLTACTSKIDDSSSTADADADADADSDADTDADSDADTDADSDADTDADSDTDVDEDPALHDGTYTGNMILAGRAVSSSGAETTDICSGVGNISFTARAASSPMVTGTGSCFFENGLAMYGTVTVTFTGTVNRDATANGDATAIGLTVPWNASFMGPALAGSFTGTGMAGSTTLTVDGQFTAPKM